MTRRTKRPSPPAPPRLPPSVSKARFDRGDIDLDVPHADPERDMHDQRGVVIGAHEIRTARVRSGHSYLLAQRAINPDHWEAAERYLDVVAAMGGVRDAEWAGGVRVPPQQQGHPSEAMVEAHARMRRAIEGVGRGPMGIISAVCLDGATLAGLALLLGEPRRQTIGRLKAALERLRDVWGMDVQTARPRRPNKPA